MELPRWRDNIVAAAGMRVNALSGGDYDLVARLDRSGRFTAEVLKDIVESSGLTLAEPPLWAWSQLAVQETCEDGGPVFLVSFPLYCLDGTQGPLVMTFLMRPDHRGRVLTVAVEDLRIVN